MSAEAAVDHLAEYVALKDQIAGLEEKAAAAREAALEMLDGGQDAPVGQVWEFPGLAVVTKVKGRTSETLDRGRLARAGVDPALLDAATVRKEGAPTYRVVRDDGDGE